MLQLIYFNVQFVENKMPLKYIYTAGEFPNILNRHKGTSIHSVQNCVMLFSKVLNNHSVQDSMFLHS